MQTLMRGIRRIRLTPRKSITRGDPLRSKRSPNASSVHSVVGSRVKIDKDPTTETVQLIRDAASNRPYYDSSIHQPVQGQWA